MNKNLPATQQKAVTIRDYLFSDNIKNQLAVALPKWLSVDRFLRIAFTSIMKNPRLLDCTRESLLGAIMQCAQLGLEPIMNRAHLVPYWNDKKRAFECQFQSGYAGLADLGRRSGDISNITSHVVYEKDVFDIEYGTEERLSHKPYLNGDRGKPVGVYAVWFYKDGTRSPQFLPLQECYDQHRARSQSYKSAIEKNHTNSPWITDESAMLKKTAVKVSSKLQSLSIEFMQAVELDNQAETGQTQQGFFLEPTLPEQTPTPTLEDFEATIPKGINKARLEEFLKVCAEQFKRSIDDIKMEAAEDPDEFWSAFFHWQKQQKKTKIEVSAEKSKSKLVFSFSKLNKEPLQKFEEVHRAEIPTWPQTTQDAFHEKWEAKMKQPYEVFLRRLKVINGKTQTVIDIPPSESGTPKAGQGTVVCPATGEAMTYAACENACPGDMFKTQACLERFPEK
jgi:recombination protein RecT